MEIEDILKKIDSNSEQINKNMQDIESNFANIQKNSGALDILKAFKSDSNKFFTMWIVTFIALIASIVYIICLKSEYEKVETTTETIQDIDQDTSEGSNYYVGGDYNG